ncbi:hypothetical protein DF039_35700 [Burkholderia cenocepacia]|nr:hypothetical protein DF039_35700 [Burkholderia cenocepacia]
MRIRYVAILIMMAGMIEPAHAYGYDRTSSAVAGGVVAGLVGGLLLGTAMASPPVYAASPMYAPPLSAYAPPPVYYAQPRCYWRNVQEWDGYGWALIPRQICY